MKCILCGKGLIKDELTDSKTSSIKLDCSNCGVYWVSELFIDEIDNCSLPKYLISGYIFEMNDLGKKGIEITYENYKDILASPFIPRTPQEKVNKILLYVYRHTKFYGHAIDLPKKPSICYAFDDYELSQLIQLSIDQGLCNFDNKTKLTFKGFEYCEQLKSKITEHSNKVFVAMWFIEEMRTIYENAIRPAIQDISCGHFEALKIEDLEHNEDIIDEIIANIKESRFLVADLTGHRNGVYFEAGFAKGLGLPVIYTCKNDSFADANGKRMLHFDVEHQKIIIWENGEELKKKLINRIRATIL